MFTLKRHYPHLGGVLLHDVSTQLDPAQFFFAVLGC